MWDHRNTVLHDPAGRVLMTENQQLNAQIHIQYWVGSIDLHPSDQALMRRPMEWICQKSIERKKLWLKDVTTARNNSLFIRQNPPNSTDSPNGTSPNIIDTNTGLTRWLRRASS